MTGQDAGEGLVDGPEQRVDRAVALGRGLPLVIAGGDDDRAAAVRVRAGRHRPAGEMERVGGIGDRALSGRWSVGCIGYLPVVDVAAAGVTGGRREVSLVAAAELRAGLPDRVFERVGEGRRRGRDDVRVAAHRRPFERPVRTSR